jgi:hypothetical protein
MKTLFFTKSLGLWPALDDAGAQVHTATSLFHASECELGMQCVQSGGGVPTNRRLKWSKVDQVNKVCVNTTFDLVYAAASAHNILHLHVKTPE